MQLKPLALVMEELKKEPLKRHLSKKKQGGAEITYMAWYTICDYLDHFAPGWDWVIDRINVGDKRLYMTGTLTIRGSDGELKRSASGTEQLSKDSYGDPSSNAEAMALRRAACKFGFCRKLWDHGGGRDYGVQHRLPPEAELSGQEERESPPTHHTETTRCQRGNHEWDPNDPEPVCMACGFRG